MGKKEIFLNEDEEYITLNILLKIEGFVSTGGMAKAFLAENPVIVNGENENRRGRKLYPGDLIQVLDALFIIKKR